MIIENAPVVTVSGDEYPGGHIDEPGRTRREGFAAATRTAAGAAASRSSGWGRP